MLPTKFQFIEGFQRRRLKCEKLTDDRRDAKWWQKLTFSLARWAKNDWSYTEKGDGYALNVNFLYQIFWIEIKRIEAHIVWFPIHKNWVNVNFLDWLIMCIVLITDSWITLKRRSDVTTFVNMAVVLLVRNLYFILTYPINSFLWSVSPVNSEIVKRVIVNVSNY